MACSTGYAPSFRLKETAQPGVVVAVRESAGGSRDALELHAPRMDGKSRRCLRRMSPVTRSEKRFLKNFPERPDL